MFRRYWRQWMIHSRLGTFLSIVGPGLIAAATGNDAGGITTYSKAGAQYGYSLLWVLFLLTFSLAIAQEMAARMGAVTGKGLADLIREEFGVKITVFAMTALLIANIATTVSNFAGVTAVVELFLPKEARFFVVPVIAGGSWLLLRGTYRRVERIFLVMCAIYLSYVAAALLADPPWGQVFRQTFFPDLHTIRANQTYVVMVIALIGTTVAPWMQFHVQSSVRDKNLSAAQYPITRLDVFLGAISSNLISFFIIVACAATLWGHVRVDENFDAVTAARALEPFAGSAALFLFALGFFNASMAGVVATPLSTAYAITESLGWESGLGRRVREAPLFIGIYTFVILISAILILLPNRSLLDIIVRAQVINGVLLPVTLVLMLRLVNTRRLMGDYVNSLPYNILASLTVISVSLISLVYLGMFIWGMSHG